MNQALERFAVDLSSWYWWLTVVLVAVAVNVFSGYLKSGLDALFTRLGTRTIRRESVSDQRFLEALNTALAPELLPYATQRETRLWFIALLLFLGAILVVAAIAAIGAVPSALGAFLPYYQGALGIMAFLLIAAALSMAGEALRQAGTNFMARSLHQSHSRAHLESLRESHVSKMERTSTSTAERL